MPNIAHLVKQANDYIEFGDLDKALKIGYKLKKSRYSGAFEIIARVYYAKEDIQQAVKILHEGVTVNPKDWLLWVQLGNYLSDLECYNDADAAYKMAINSSNSDISQVELNMAVLYERMERFDEAIEICKNLLNTEKDPEIRFRTLLLVVNLHRDISLYDQALFYGNNAVSLLSNSHDFETSEISRLYSALAYIVWQQKDKDLSLCYIRQALLNNRLNEDALWLLREITNLKSSHSKYFHLLIYGKQNSEEFFTNFGIIADTPEEALYFAKEFEPNEFRKAFQIEKSQVLRSAKEELKGVYESTGIVFFDSE